MAKKKYASMVEAFTALKSTKVSDNNPDGPSNLPDDNINGCQYDKNTMFMPGLIGEGESPNKEDVNVITANGVSSSKGQGNNNVPHYWKGNSGIWNENTDWDGANLTGM